MSTVQEIESAILKLAAPQLSELSKWFDDHIERSWDARMETDAQAGKFDRFKQDIDRAKASGTLIDFP
jgi:hypothetical protein